MSALGSFTANGAPDASAVATAAAAARADPDADITVLGVPLTDAELQVLHDSGMYLDGAAPLLLWTQAGRPDLFGGVWIDPPGSRRHVISIVEGTRSTRELASCLERPGIDVRYVVARRSFADVDALAERISGEWDLLREAGIDIFSSGPRHREGTVGIEVEGLTTDQAAFLRERYGEDIILEGRPAPTPDRPLDLAEVGFSIGEDVLIGQGDGRQGPRGAWRLIEGRLTDDSLKLQVVIEPPGVDLPVEAGPAVLFAGMELYGGSGDMGIAEPLDALVMLPLAACEADPCAFVAELVMPRRQMEPALRRLEANTDEVLWLTVNATLVRTFAHGTWLQVLPLDSPDERRGRVGAIEPLRGSIFPFGLFPAEQARPIRAEDERMWTTDFDWPKVVERERRAMGDRSAPVPEASGTLNVTFEPKCPHAAGLTMHSDGGATVVDAEAYDTGRIRGQFAIPVGTTWRLTLHDGGGIDFDQRAGWGVRVGQIRSNGPDLVVQAAFDCAVPSGSVEVTTEP
jgi:hypothetical protein